MKLAIPSTMMLCFEWWIYEVGGFLAGAFYRLKSKTNLCVNTQKPLPVK